MADYATIRYEDAAAPVARITLNRPEKRNPIGPLTAGELIHALVAARENPAIRVIVITGAGEVFSAGGDLSAMSGQGGAGTASPAQPESLVKLFLAMHDLGKPIIAMVNGHALAGGMGLMVACDLLIPSAPGQFGTTAIAEVIWTMII